MGVSHTSCNVFLVELFPIFNESGYTFDDFRPIPHEVGFQRRWFSIREQIFNIFVLTPHEYPFLRGPIRGCAQKFELHDGNTIIPHIEVELLCFRVSYQPSPPLNMYGLMKALKFGISSIMWGITGTLSKSMYNFMRSGMVGKKISCNFLLQRSNDASMLSCVCPALKKDTNIYLKIPFATSNDQKQNTYPHLLSLVQLSS